MQDGCQQVWPVMLTPFTSRNEIDYAGLEKLIDWYEGHGVDGLFAVCQSSEMFYLSLRERVELASFVKKHAKIPVIASGHVSVGFQDQIQELRRIADTGVDAVILLTNRMGEPNDSPESWIRRLDMLLDAIDDTVPLGLYECPYPYKRLLGIRELEYCMKSGRFRFLKDTCCDPETLQRRAELLRGSVLKLYNANTSTLLHSYRHGASGFSGVMANFHPEWYVWLSKNWRTQPERANLAQALLSACSQYEKQCYPINAKYHLTRQSVPITLVSRSRNAEAWQPLYEAEMDQMSGMMKALENAFWQSNGPAPHTV